METILSAIEAKRDVLCATADFLWDHPETAFTEFESAKYICDVLRREGFTVEENLCGIPTAFKGSVADISMFLRLAVTGKTNAPDLWTVMQILGYDRTVARLNAMLETL